MEITVIIKAIIETAIYVHDLQATEAFYGTILGLRVMGKEPGRHVFFQVGAASVLLAFLAEATLKGARCRRMEPPGQAISPWVSKPRHWTPGGNICTATASPSRKRSSGRKAVSPFTFVIQSATRWNWSHLGCGGS
jgi:catechol 2,3-dioxygenase-like lactoylglutathione lyase family enzyme